MFGIFDDSDIRQYRSDLFDLDKYKYEREMEYRKLRDTLTKLPPVPEEVRVRVEKHVEKFGELFEIIRGSKCPKCDFNYIVSAKADDVYHCWCYNAREDVLHSGSYGITKMEYLQEVYCRYFQYEEND